MNAGINDEGFSPTPIEYFITPITPYFLCNHFIATEIHKSDLKYIDCNINIKANDLLQNKNYSDIKNNEIIQIQVDHFDFFYDEVIPILVKNDVKVVIITSQWHYPQIHKNDKTDTLLNHNNILLWISQNPIYSNHEKYMAFPYGICQTYIDDYADFLKLFDINNVKKNIKLLNQYASAHDNLPENHIRKKIDIFGKNSGEKMSYTSFLNNILNAEFVISTSGDRDDCYRHYECIGLNAIPVSDIQGGYKEIFGENMIYSNADEMFAMFVNKRLGIDDITRQPNRDIITIPYWVSRIKGTYGSLMIPPFCEHSVCVLGEPYNGSIQGCSS